MLKMKKKKGVRIYMVISPPLSVPPVNQESQYWTSDSAAENKSPLTEASLP